MAPKTVEVSSSWCEEDIKGRQKGKKTWSLLIKPKALVGYCRPWPANAHYSSDETAWDGKKPEFWRGRR
jgi:hypothetical protein